MQGEEEGEQSLFLKLDHALVQVAALIIDPIIGEWTVTKHR